MIIESKLWLTLDASLWGVQSGLPLLFSPCVRLDLKGEENRKGLAEERERRERSTFI